jgi:AcrR family transcriptional regulator
MEAGAKPRSGKAPPRRTQAERRAKTRAALLDATIECLIEDGYAGTTTTRIVERAGVSRGAQVHHFPTKGELVAEAVRHLAERRAAELSEEVRATPARGRHRFERMLDLLWRIHNGPLFAASVELWVAARSDEEVRRRLVEVEREVSAITAKGIDELFPQMATNREFREAVDASLATMRGLALVRSVYDDREMERRWAGARRTLVAAVAGIQD